MSDLPALDQLGSYPHPRDTEKLIGQEEAEQALLSNFTSERFHHAWLVTGSKGVGKATLAYRATKFILSGQGEGGLFGPPTSLDVEGGESDLALIKAEAHPGLAVLKRQYDPKGKKFFSVIRVDDVRALSGFFRLTASDGGWRVVIIDSIDEMNISAANAILKILEEPPEKTVFFLLSHAPGGLLPTIRSRCRQLALRPLGETEMHQALAPYLEGVTEEQVARLLTLSEGSPGKALQILDAGGLDIYAAILEIFKGFPTLDPEKTHGLADAVGRKDGEEMYRVICELFPWWLSHIVRTGAGGSDSEQAAPPGEAEIMRRLLDNRPLTGWVDLWEKSNRLIAKADSINLDRKQVVLNLFLNVERMT